MGLMCDLRVVVTGGAGFLGSHLVDELMGRGCRVAVVDDLSNGCMENIEGWLGSSDFVFVEGDLKQPGVLDEVLMEEESVVFHLAANPEVRVGETAPEVHFRENLVVTFNVLESVRRCGGVQGVVFASTSTVYGEAEVMPTPEGYGPLVPISTYGATKLGCEALVTSYSYTFGVHGLILRLANVVGGRSNHGVIPDFIRKLRRNRTELEILGDGSQEKSYLYIEDCVRAVLQLTHRFLEGDHRVGLYNVGSKDRVTVKRIGEIVVEEMGLEDVKFNFTGGVEGGRGWKGDVKEMQLSVDKLLEEGWKPKYNSEEAVRMAVRSLLDTL